MGSENLHGRGHAKTRVFHEGSPDKKHRKSASMFVDVSSILEPKIDKKTRKNTRGRKATEKRRAQASFFAKTWFFPSLWVSRASQWGLLGPPGGSLGAPLALKIVTKFPPGTLNCPLRASGPLFLTFWLDFGTIFEHFGGHFGTILG